MNFFLQILSLFITIFIVFSCNSENLAGGGSDHPNELSGSVAQNGSPIRSSVILYKKQVAKADSMYVKMDSLQTDIQGKFRFKNLQNGTYSVIAQDSSRLLKSVWSDIELSQKDSAKDTTMTLGATASLKGRIVGVSGLYAVYLGGTPYWVNIDSQTGAFEFKSIPTGSVSLLTFYNLNGVNVLSIPSTVVLKAGEVKDLGDIVVHSNQILLEDFSDNDDRISTKNLFRGGWWFLNQNYLFSPAKMQTRIYEGVVDSLGNRYLSFSAEPAFGQTTSPTLGFNIGIGWGEYKYNGGLEENAVFDFSKMSVFKFKARGQGRFILQFGTQSIEESTYPWAQYKVELQLTSEWKEYVIKAEDLKLPQVEKPELLNSMNWANASKRVYAVSFLFPQGIQMSLDDIKIDGFNLSDWTR